MSTTQKVKNITFSFKAIELLSFELIQLDDVDLKNLTSFNFDIKSEIKLNNDLKLVLVVLTVDTYNQNKTKKFGSISTSCIFEVTEYDQYVDTKGNTLHFPDDFTISINSIAYSTTRGIMFSQFRGTFLHAAILPVIDPKTFIINKK